MTAIKWNPRTDAQGAVIPGLWVTDNGYAIAECLQPEAHYVVTRPGESSPCFFTPDRHEATRLIDADERALA